jgi:charged multivesicular body protein 7
MRKQSMVPMPVYKTDAASLSKSSWRVIDSSSFNPRNAMSWGLRQLKGLLIGPENASSSVRLKVQQLVLVENLKVCLRVRFHPAFNDPRI